MTHYRLTATLMLTWLSLFGCHMFEDADNVNECPMGSGYPCPCDAVASPVCDDNSDCYSPAADYRGFCADKCVDNSDCTETGGYGLSGACALSINAPQDRANHCVVICDDGIETTQCPPGQECEWQAQMSRGICLPFKGN